MHGGVASGAPTGALAQQRGVGDVADVDFSGSLMLHLRVAFETKIGVRFDQELAIDRAVRIVAGGAAFTKGFVFENEWSGLLAMTCAATFISPGHGQASAGGLEDVGPVRVMALEAVHSALNDRMMLRKIEFSLSLQMTLKTNRRLFAGVHDEFAAPAAGFDVLAAGAVAGLASGLANEFGVLEMDARVGAGGEHAGDVGMALVTGFVADVACARNLGRSQDGAFEAGTGDKQHRGDKTECGQGEEFTPRAQSRFCSVALHRQMVTYDFRSVLRCQANSASLLQGYSQAAGSTATSGGENNHFLRPEIRLPSGNANALADRFGFSGSTVTLRKPRRLLAGQDARFLRAAALGSLEFVSKSSHNDERGGRVVCSRIASYVPFVQNFGNNPQFGESY